MNPNRLQPDYLLSSEDDVLDREEFEEEEQARRDKTVKYLTRLMILILFLVPMGYIAALAATFIHEVFGHGFATILVGGSIKGLSIQWDGQGLATIFMPADLPRYDKAFIYLAGIFVTVITSLVLVRLGIHRGIPYFPRLAILTVASECLMGAGPMYIFWNSLFPLKGHNWDITNVLDLFDSDQLRILLVFIGLVLMIVAMVLVNIILYRAFGEWLNTEKERERYQYVVPLIVLFVAHSSRWVTNQLLLSIGYWTILVMLALTLVVLGGIYHVNLEMPTYRKDIRESYLPIIAAYLAAAVLLVVVFLYL